VKLELLEIPKPCDVPWDSMAGDERVRHCKHCHLDVYDLSALTRAEAEHFLETREGVCVTLLKRHDGTVVTQDCESKRDAAATECAQTAPTALRLASLAQGEASSPAPAPPRAPAPPTATTPAPAPAPPRASAPAAAPPRAPSAPSAPPKPTIPAPPPPPVRMGGAPPPAPPIPTAWETVDPRVGRGTLLADLVRAIRAGLGADDAERRVREVERALELPANWRTAQCVRTKCPLWIPGGTDPVPPDFLTPRTELLTAIEPATRAAFAKDRADILLREVRRTAFAGSRGSCPHCRAFIGLPPAPPTL